MTMWPSAFTAVLLLVSQLACGILGGGLVETFGRRRNVEGSMRAYAEAVVEQDVERRQATVAGSNATTWDAQTTAACLSALTKLNGVASNPAGMALCYNLPYLDSSTGIFMADLRLYMVAQPTDAFSGIPAQNVTVSLQYAGASVQTISSNELTGRGVASSIVSLPINARGDVVKRQAMTPVQIQMYALKGYINLNLMTPNMTNSTLESLLIPVVTLSASTASSTIAKTTLASKEATFVNGVFSSAAGSTAEFSTTSAPFLVPGKQILIFPIGGIITGVWAAAFIATVTYGTIGRIQFRDSYRRRLARARQQASARI